MLESCSDLSGLDNTQSIDFVQLLPEIEKFILDVIYNLIGEDLIEQTPSISVDDLKQVGITQAFIVYNKSFNPDKSDFLNYAKRPIRGAILLAFKKAFSIYAAPNNRYSLRNKVEKAYYYLYAKTYKKPTAQEIYEVLQYRLQQRKKKNLISKDYRGISLRLVQRILDEIRVNDAMGRVDVEEMDADATSSGDLDILNDVYRREISAYIASILDTIPGRNREIIKMYYGFNTRNNEPMTLRSIGNHFGITRQRVGQIITNFHYHVKNELADRLTVDDVWFN